MQETDMDVPGRTAAADLDWAVLSLERTPERLARFMVDNGPIGLQIDIVPATDGDEVNLRELASLGLVIPEDMEEWQPAAVGNALSHWLCWYQAVETKRPTGIFEDRALLRRDLPEKVLGLLDGLPEGWDLLVLGYNVDSVIDFEISPDCRFRGSFSGLQTNPPGPVKFVDLKTPVAPIRAHNAFGSFAYMVSPAGAQKLIDACFPLTTKSVGVHALGVKVRSTSIDVLMNSVFSTLQTYVSFPPLATRVD